MPTHIIPKASVDIFCVRPDNFRAFCKYFRKYADLTRKTSVCIAFVFNVPSALYWGATSHAAHNFSTFASALLFYHGLLQIPGQILSMPTARSWAFPRKISRACVFEPLNLRSIHICLHIVPKAPAKTHVGVVIFETEEILRLIHRHSFRYFPSMASRKTWGYSVISFAMKRPNLPDNMAAWVTAHPPANKSTNVCDAGRFEITHFAILFLEPL